MDRFYKSGAAASLYLPLTALLRQSVSRDAFLAELARRGHRRTERWHEHWIELGLIARGKPSGRRGGGSQYLWPWVQVEHAAAMLGKLEEGVALGSLPKYVAWTWLWWGDDWISFPQVARAMRTWSRAERDAPIKNVRASAADLANVLAHPRAKGKRRLIRALTDFPPNGDVETLREAVNNVIDPTLSGQGRGPKGAELNADSYLAMIAARQRAVGHLAKYTREQYSAARSLYLESRADYARDQPRYSRDPDLGSMHPAPTLSDIADSACLDLLTCLAVLFERRVNRSAESGAGMHL